MAPGSNVQAASSAALLLKTRGLRVSMIKIDPYLNVDAGTMAPTEHGEVFVLEDGGEVDLDLGNYERYLDITLTREHSITTGKTYQHVIERERAGHYIGQTVQLIPHLTRAVQEWIERVARIPVDGTGEEPDVCVIELGGTVGDMENAPFVEALRQLRRSAGPANFVHAHVSHIPIVNADQKTKPTQQAIRIVRSAGLDPDLVRSPPISGCPVATGMPRSLRGCPVANVRVADCMSMPGEARWGHD
jgi:CTP synthase